MLIKFYVHTITDTQYKGGGPSWYQRVSSSCSFNPEDFNHNRNRSGYTVEHEEKIVDISEFHLKYLILKCRGREFEVAEGLNKLGELEEEWGTHLYDKLTRIIDINPEEN